MKESFKQIDKKCKMYNHIVWNTEKNLTDDELRGMFLAIKEYVVYGTYFQDFQEITGFDLKEVEEEVMK